MKRGVMGPEIIIGMILALAFLGVVGNLIQKIDQGTTKGYDSKLCKQSVVLNAEARFPIAEGQEWELNCPTRYVTINEDNILTESRNFEVKKKIECGNLGNDKEKECLLLEANKAISQLIFECWDQFAAGRLRVLSAYESDRQCVICSRFEFGEEVREEFSELGNSVISLSRFGAENQNNILDEYMRTHNPRLHKISYYEFTLDAADAIQLPFYDYNIQDPYGIIFVVKNKNQFTSFIQDAWESIKALDLVFGVEEEDEFINVLEVVKYNEVKSYCDLLS